MENYILISNYELSEMELSIGREIRCLRKKNGMSGEKLGLLLGVSQQQISRYESAKSKVTINTLFTILNLFNVSLVRFFERVFTGMNKTPEYGNDKEFCSLFNMEE